MTKRDQLIDEIDTKFEMMINQLKITQVDSVLSETNKDFESIYSLNTGTGIFKGKKPIRIIFSDKSSINVPTWKKVIEEILKDCIKDPEREKKLMDLREKMQGRDRVLLGSAQGSMRSPIKIKEALYVETHYDTETLLRILTTRILSAVAYDYKNIKIAVRNN